MIPGAIVLLHIDYSIRGNLGHYRDTHHSTCPLSCMINHEFSGAKVTGFPWFKTFSFCPLPTHQTCFAFLSITDYHRDNWDYSLREASQTLKENRVTQ
ncbi:mCG145705 [Mus musculus]|nr:mCG145705 [Mus musculus]